MHRPSAASRSVRAARPSLAGRVARELRRDHARAVHACAQGRGLGVQRARAATEYHYNLDYTGARLDSYSARVTVCPTRNCGAVARGPATCWRTIRLETPIGMQRYGASILRRERHRRASGGRAPSIWGVNIHHHGSREHNHDPNATGLKFYHVSASALLETTAAVTKTDRGLRPARAGIRRAETSLGFIGGDLTQLFTIRVAVARGHARCLVRRGSACGRAGRARLAEPAARDAAPDVPGNRDADRILGVCAGAVSWLNWLAGCGGDHCVS